jgi:amino acid transporter
MPGQIFRTKSLDALTAEAEEPSHQLKRSLGSFDVVMLGIGAIVGAGIFATIGTAAAGDATRPGAGPALIVSFILTGIACGFAALCYAEFAAMVPISGSAYTYAYATLGELVAWIIGWDLIIEYAVGNVAVAISWATTSRRCSQVSESSSLTGCRPTTGPPRAYPDSLKARRTSSACRSFSTSSPSASWRCSRLCSSSA